MGPYPQCEGQGLVLLKYSLNICKSCRTVGIPTETQLDLFFSRLARLKDVEPGMRIRGSLLFVEQM